jgi:transposase-like protein
MEWVAFMYLRSLSFNQVRAIMFARYKKDIFTKDRLIHHIEALADRIPSNERVSTWLALYRSGYYALDGTWLVYRGQNIVLLILFNVATLDVVSYTIAMDETKDSYTRLIEKALSEIVSNMKGIHCDGDPGLMKAVRNFFPKTPIQLCVFHKYSRSGQLIPFKRPKTKKDKIIKEKTEKVLFATSKKEAYEALYKLERYARAHESYKELQELIRVLKRNFDLLLTHFDNPEMSPYNNVLEGFNSVIKRRTRLMKGFKKPVNIQRWIKLMIIDWRFHVLEESEFKDRRGQSPLQLAKVDLPRIHNWMTHIRENYTA